MFMPVLAILDLSINNLLVALIVLVVAVILIVALYRLAAPYLGQFSGLVAALIVIIVILAISRILGIL